MNDHADRIESIAMDLYRGHCAGLPSERWRTWSGEDDTQREHFRRAARAAIAALEAGRSGEAEQDARRWHWATHHATQHDWQQMAARCTTRLALDRYADYGMSRPANWHDHCDDVPPGSLNSPTAAAPQQPPVGVDEAFAVAMQGRSYGSEETRNAHDWFKAGFAAAISQQEAAPSVSGKQLGEMIFRAVMDGDDSAVSEPAASGDAEIVAKLQSELDDFGLVGIRQAEFDAIRRLGNAPDAASGEGYDRELIARMLETEMLGRRSYDDDATREQIRLLREADNRDAAGVHTARRLTTTPDAASGEGLHAALCFLGELESVGNAKAGEIARGLRRLTTTTTEQG